MSVNNKNENSSITFKSLGIDEVICDACEALKWTIPTKIQIAAIPLALQGNDIIGLAETGSGKTGAFALPILHALLQKPQRFFALVLTPTRELAMQIGEQFEAIGTCIKLRVAVLVGGMDRMLQKQHLDKKPHIIVATPGRLVDHLEQTKDFNLRALKYLVMDEADRMLKLNFQEEMKKILAVIPRERRTFLFSATMTDKVEELQRACLRDPVKVEVSRLYQTVDNLIQHYVWTPADYKESYLVHLLRELQGNSCIVFCNSCNHTQEVALMLRALNFTAIPLHGQMSQQKRLSSLKKFRNKDKAILVATDVASRGLDIPHVDAVINYYIPDDHKCYIHRVGRAARAGRAGKAFTIVTQYFVKQFQEIEAGLDTKIPRYALEHNEVLPLIQQVKEAKRKAETEMNEQSKNKKRKRKDDNDVDSDADETSTARKSKKKNKNRR